MSNRNNKKKHLPEDLVITINDHKANITFYHITEPIMEYAVLVKSPDDVCTVFDVSNLSLFCDYNFNKKEWKAVVNFSNRIYNISTSNPYDSEYSIVIFVKSASLIILAVMASPTLHGIPLSGFLVEVGVKDKNYYKVAEEASAFIQIISDKSTREIIEKERADIENKQCDVITDDVDGYTDSYNYFICENYYNNGDDYNTEGYDYE